MTHSTTIEQLPGHLVVDRKDGDAVEGMARADIAVPHLVAVQRRYEEAGAHIVTPAPSSSHSTPSSSDRYPETEEIDVRALKPPVAHIATPPTEAMSLAAILLAERSVIEEMRSSASAQTGAAVTHGTVSG
jgi:hypothetical protein